jgi:phosphatidylserine/phosphatidylglycerophosphate/cardiolipin synthase-like enzyme
MNWTNSAENTNDENTIVIENKELALQFKNEFLRLWKSIPDKWLRNDPKAESFDSVNSCFDGVDNNHNGVYDFDEYACGSVMYDKINSYYQNRSH